MTPRQPRRAGIAILTAGMAALAGCGNGTTTSPPSSTTAHSRPVPTPLNSAKFKTDPCTAITIEQLTSIGFAPGTRKAGRDGECYIEFTATSGISVLRSVDQAVDGLDSLYVRHARGFDTGNHWEERTIDGYPAVIVAIEDNTPSRRNLGPLSCTLSLSIDDATTATIKVNTYEQPSTGPWQYNPCGSSTKIAAFAVENLHS